MIFLLLLSAWMCWNQEHQRAENANFRVRKHNFSDCYLRILLNQSLHEKYYHFVLVEWAIITEILKHYDMYTVYRFQQTILANGDDSADSQNQNYGSNWLFQGLFWCIFVASLLENASFFSALKLYFSQEEFLLSKNEEILKNYWKGLFFIELPFVSFVAYQTKAQKGSSEGNGSSSTSNNNSGSSGGSGSTSGGGNFRDSEFQGFYEYYYFYFFEYWTLLLPQLILAFLIYTPLCKKFLQMQSGRQQQQQQQQQHMFWPAAIQRAQNTTLFVGGCLGALLLSMAPCFVDVYFQNYENYYILYENEIPCTFKYQLTYSSVRFLLFGLQIFLMEIWRQRRGGQMLLKVRVAFAFHNGVFFYSSIARHVLQKAQFFEVQHADAALLLNAVCGVEIQSQNNENQSSYYQKKGLQVKQIQKKKYKFENAFDNYEDATLVEIIEFKKHNLLALHYYYPENIDEHNRYSPAFCVIRLLNRRNLNLVSEFKLKLEDFQDDAEEEENEQQMQAKKQRIFINQESFILCYQKRQAEVEFYDLFAKKRIFCMQLPRADLKMCMFFSIKNHCGENFEYFVFKNGTECGNSNVFVAKIASKNLKSSSNSPEICKVNALFRDHDDTFSPHFNFEITRFAKESLLIFESCERQFFVYNCETEQLKTDFEIRGLNMNLFRNSSKQYSQTQPPISEKKQRNFEFLPIREPKIHEFHLFAFVQSIYNGDRYVYLCYYDQIVFQQRITTSQQQYQQQQNQQQQQEHQNEDNSSEEEIEFAASRNDNLLVLVFGGKTRKAKCVTVLDISEFVKPRKQICDVHKMLCNLSLEYYYNYFHYQPQNNQCQRQQQPQFYYFSQ